MNPRAHVLPGMPAAMTRADAETIVAQWLGGTEFPQAVVDEAFELVEADEDEAAVNEELRRDERAMVWTGLTIAGVALLVLIGWAGRHWAWW